jgi:hypothetical protein
VNSAVTTCPSALIVPVLESDPGIPYSWWLVRTDQERESCDADHWTMP